MGELDNSFLADVLADPEDVAIRLIYADYLEETGDPASALRAEFIRASIYMEQTPKTIIKASRQVFGTPLNLSNPEYQKFKGRARELLKAYGEDWTDKAGLMRRAGDGSRVLIVHGVGWRRGFLEELFLKKVVDWEAIRDAVLATHPITKVEWVNSWVDPGPAICKRGEPVPETVEQFRQKCDEMCQRLRDRYGEDA